MEARAHAGLHTNGLVRILLCCLEKEELEQMGGGEYHSRQNNYRCKSLINSKATSESKKIQN